MSPLAPLRLTFPRRRKSDAGCFGLNRGVTLIELLVTLTILAILLGLAAPLFVRLIADNTLSTQVNSLLTDTRFARSEAIKRGVNVTICASENSDDANDKVTCAGSDWKTGWVVFVDTNHDSVRDAGEEIIRRQEPFSGSYSITGIDGTVLKSWRFNAEGRIQDAGNGLNFATGAGQARSRYLCVSLTGRVRLADPEATSCS